MNNLFLVCVSKSYYNNKIFDLKSDTNRDDYYYPFYLLKKRFFELGVSIDTFDFFKKSHSKDYGLIFFDIPKNIRAILKIHKNVKKYLVIFESEMLLPQNYNKNLHTQFEKVFTWNDDLVDSGKYVKFFWPNKSSQKTDISSKKKLCSMIVANKTNKHHLELYSERLKAIEWFEQNRPEDFDLFGFGWDRHYCKWPLSKLNKLKTIRRIFKPYHISYRGEAKS
ncbi:hypothetical protein FJZ20_02655, partial [Candidatus Pacearchaeota archaeon]|nr:hypothetical protein [Candidatus Pacearchaeota archaeon]